MKRSRSKWSLLAVLAMVFAMVPLTAASAAPSVVAFDMVGSASSNLISHTNAYAGAFTSPADGFEKYQRGVSSSIPFDVMDDSLITYPADTQGVIDDNNLDEFFGAADTVNGDTSGAVSATWSFDITGATGLGVSIDMGAMGDFEASSDSFVWTYSIDGAASEAVFTSSVDEAASLTYTMAGGATVTLNDPLAVNGVTLNNVLQTVSAAIVGAGTVLDLTLTVTTNGASEGYAVQNIVIEEGVAPPPPPPGASEEKIYDVQGPGLSSPLEGQDVIVEGVVTSDQQDGDFNGFFMQDVVGDGVEETSDGIFVYDDGFGVDVNVGDTVRAEGTVVEFYGETQIGSVVDVTVTGAATFTATVVTLPFIDFDQPEWYEGMYIVVPQPMTISEYFNFDRYGEIVLTVGRPATPTAVYDPGSPEQAALALENALGRITLDDNRTSQNPDPAIHPNGADFDLDNLFRGGDTVENTTGVINYSFGSYKIQPTQGADYTPTNARQTSPDAVGGSLSVATFNVLNYFTTIDDSGSICGPDLNSGCRGADSPEEFERQRTKIIAAIAEINADVVGLMEIENFVDGGIDEPITDLVSGINDLLGAGTYAAVETGAIGDDAIKVAFIYKPATVSLNGAYAVLDSSVDPTFNDDKNRPALAQTFTQLSNGESVTVAVNHLKSKGSSCSSIGDPGLDDGAGNCNLTRTSAAVALVNWLAADATGTGEDNVLIVGDLNSYDKEDPIDAIIAGGYSDLVADFGGEFAYSYVFSGQWGYLDYAMANASLQSAITGTTVWHINADEPDILDYNIDYKKPPQQALYEPNAFRASDHDPVIVGIEFDITPPVVTADLVPDHGRFFTVEYSCVDAVDPNPTCVGDINGVPVEDGQTVALIWSNGKAKSWHTGPTLFIKDSSFTLTVVGTDESGNTDTAIKVL